MLVEFTRSFAKGEGRRSSPTASGPKIRGGRRPAAIGPGRCAAHPMGRPEQRMRGVSPVLPNPNAVEAQLIVTNPQDATRSTERGQARER
jgi:hypothetical protein